MPEKQSKKGRTLGQVWGVAKEGMGEVLRKGAVLMAEKRMDLQQEMHHKLLEEKSSEKPEMMKELFVRLQEKYPRLKLKGERYAVLGMDDPDVDYFLENCSLQTLKDLAIVTPRKHFTYLNVPWNWQLAIKNNPKMEKYRDALFNEPDVDLNLEELYHKIRSGMKEINDHLFHENQWFGSEFSGDLDPRVLMAIFINEIAPDHVGVEGKTTPHHFPSKVKFTQKARIEVYRMMIEAGWQPQKMPAQNVMDNGNKVESYGIDQFTKPTAKGLNKLYKRKPWDKKKGNYLDGLLPENFEEQVTLENQVTRSLLLTYDNLGMLDESIGSYRTVWKRRFLQTYGKATPEQKSRFVIAVVAAMHNKGGRSSLVRNATEAMMTGKYTDLDGARALFLGRMNRGAKARRYTKRTAKIYDLIEVYNELESWDPENGIDFDSPRRIFSRELDKKTLAGMGLPSTYVPAITETLHEPSGPKDWSYFPEKEYNGVLVRYVPVKKDLFFNGLLTHMHDADVFQDFQDAEDNGYIKVPLGMIQFRYKNATYLSQLGL